MVEDKESFYFGLLVPRSLGEGGWTLVFGLAVKAEDLPL
jgi:hypothetical protein